MHRHQFDSSKQLVGSSTVKPNDKMKMVKSSADTAHSLACIETQHFRYTGPKTYSEYHLQRDQEWLYCFGQSLCQDPYPLQELANEH